MQKTLDVVPLYRWKLSIKANASDCQWGVLTNQVVLKCTTFARVYVTKK